MRICMHNFLIRCVGKFHYRNSANGGLRPPNSRTSSTLRRPPSTEAATPPPRRSQGSGPSPGASYTPSPCSPPSVRARKKGEYKRYASLVPMEANVAVAAVASHSIRLLSASFLPRRWRKEIITRGTTSPPPPPLTAMQATKQGALSLASHKRRRRYTNH